MRNNTYQSAVDHLKFSEDLMVHCMSVRRTAGIKPIRKLVIVAAAIILLASTVYAADVWVKQFMRTDELGTVKILLNDAEVMQFSESENNDGVSVRYMMLEPKDYAVFHDGLLYAKNGGFYKISEEYELITLESKNNFNSFVKDGKRYTFNRDYVQVGNQIYTDYLMEYVINDDGEIFVNLNDADGLCWPAYINLESGEIRDALPGFSREDFIGRICSVTEFRGGYLIYSLVEQYVRGDTESEQHYYWIDGEKSSCQKINLPAGWDYIEGNSFYYKDTNNTWYSLDENFQFLNLTNGLKTTDDMNHGLLTVCNTDDSLGIVDVEKGVVYHIPDISLTKLDLQETLGYNASRNSSEGNIVLTYSSMNWEEQKRELEKIALLDADSGLLKTLHIDTDYTIHTHGWLDDHRYAVIYEDTVKRYLCIYEFE